MLIFIDYCFTSCNQITFFILNFNYLKIGGGYPAYEQPPPSFRQQGSQQSFNGSSGGNGYGGPPSSGYGGPGSFGGNFSLIHIIII